MPINHVSRCPGSREKLPAPPCCCWGAGASSRFSLSTTGIFASFFSRERAEMPLCPPDSALGLVAAEGEHLSLFCGGVRRALVQAPAQVLVVPSSLRLLRRNKHSSGRAPGLPELSLLQAEPGCWPAQHSASRQSSLKLHFWEKGAGGKKPPRCPIGFWLRPAAPGLLHPCKQLPGQMLTNAPRRGRWPSASVGRGSE